MEQNVITFSGDNKQLFNRYKIENLSSRLTLLVPETHNAILIKDGQMLQTLSSGKYLVSKFVDVKNEIDSNLEVLFMSKTAKLNLLWGTAQKFLMYDANLQENYRVGMSGDYDVQIGDPRKCYLYLIGADNDLTTDDLQDRLQTTVVSVVENVVVEYVSAQEILFNQVTVKKREISAKVLTRLNQKLMGEYGIAVYSFNIANIIIDDDDYAKLSGNFKSNSKQTKDVVYCPDCGTELSASAKFCNNCGRKIGGAKICPECKTENNANAKFCQNCGARI